MVKLKTVAALSSNAILMLRMLRMSTSFYRVAFLAAACSEGLLAMLHESPMTAEQIGERIAPGSDMREELRAWLDFGVCAGVLRCRSGRYQLRGIAKALGNPANDMLAAIPEEMIVVDQPSIVGTPAAIRDRRRFTTNERQGTIVARSSRIVEPFIFEQVDAVTPSSGPARVLDVGCGSGVYIRRALERNPQISALGLELQPAVAAFARENLRAWGIAARATVEAGDVRDRETEPVYDVVMLNNNIYYFPIDDRVPLLRHLKGFLKPGGKLLLTTLCRGKDVASGFMNLWGTTTEGGAPLPEATDLAKQLSLASFGAVRAKRMIPGFPWYAFVAQA